MNEKSRKSFWGKLLLRRIRKTAGKILDIEKAIGVYHGPLGGNHSKQK